MAEKPPRIPGVRRLPLTAAALTAALVLTGCGSSTTIDDIDPSPTPSVESPQPTTSEESSPETITVPECEGIVFEEDAAIAGEYLSACVIGFSVAAASGRMNVTGEGLQGAVEFLYGTEPQAHVVSQAPPFELIVTDDGTWLSSAGGWTSGEEAERIGMLWRGVAQPAVAFAMLAESDYTVTAHETIEPVEGAKVASWRVTADGPISVEGVVVEALELWITGDHVPVRQESVASFAGIRTSLVNEYYDWGADISIESPAAG